MTIPRVQPGDERHLRQVFREFLSGITVVSAAVGAAPEGQLHAMTANAFCSVSLEPPQVLVCVAHSARFHAAIEQAGSWSVSILAADQAEIAARFATSGRDLVSQFDGIDHIRGPHTGAALLSGAQAWLECRTSQAVPAGDHTVVIGDVLASGVNSHPAPPLAYHRGSYALNR